MTCLRCGGSGKYIGQGMMSTKCDCKELEVVDKKGSIYKKAIEEIKALDDNIDDAKAEKMFNDAYKKVKK